MLHVFFLAAFFASPTAVTPVDPSILKIQRVYVEPLTGGEDAARIRDLLITALQNSKLFTLTESLDKADTILKGAASEEAYQDKFSSSERLNARSYLGGTSGTRKTAAGNSKAPVDINVGEDESLHLEERKHDAMATVRLVNKDGDVIWSTTKESSGAKFRGAAADVADKVARQLAADFEKVKTSRSNP